VRAGASAVLLARLYLVAGKPQLRKTIVLPQAIAWGSAAFTRWLIDKLYATYVAPIHWNRPTMFYDDAHYLRTTARRLRAIAMGSFDWPHCEALEVRDHAADMYDNEARKQILVIAEGYDRLAERAEERARQTLG
jgi:hypothetical protein